MACLQYYMHRVNRNFTQKQEQQAQPSEASFHYSEINETSQQWLRKLFFFFLVFLKLQVQCNYTCIYIVETHSQSHIYCRRKPMPDHVPCTLIDRWPTHWTFLVFFLLILISLNAQRWNKFLGGMKMTTML